MSFETPNLDRPPNMNRRPLYRNRQRWNWQDVANLILGAWLFFSPWILDFGSNAATRPPVAGAVAINEVSTAAWNAWVLGAIVFLVALSAIGRMELWQEWVNLVLGAWIHRPPLPHGGLGPLDRWGAYLSYIAECDDESRANGSNAAPIRQDLGAHSSRRPTRSGRAKRSTSP